MAVQTVGILSPGEMGAGVGGALRATGLTVLTCLAGRSPASHERAEAAGIKDVPDLAALGGALRPDPLDPGAGACTWRGC